MRRAGLRGLDRHLTPRDTCLTACRVLCLFLQFARREASIASYEQQLSCLPGDVVIASSFMSYAGPFPSEYRDELVRQTWLPQVKALHIPASEVRHRFVWSSARRLRRASSRLSRRVDAALAHVRRHSCRTAGRRGEAEARGVCARLFLGRVAPAGV